MCDQLAEIADTYVRHKDTSVRLQESNWARVRISKSLINQYPDVYWRVIFTMFENDLIELKDKLPLMAVAAYLDCHGLVPVEYHHEQDEAHPYRTQDRPRLRQLWRQFAPDNQYAPRRAAFVPPQDGIVLFEELDRILGTKIPHTAQGRDPASGERIMTVRFSDLYFLLRNLILEFEHWNTRLKNMPDEKYQRPFTEKRVHQARLAYYLTVFERFRFELQHLRESAIVIGPTVQEHLNLAMQQLQNDALIRTRVYRGLGDLLAMSDNYARAQVALWDYLQLIGAYTREWVSDWRTENGLEEYYRRHNKPDTTGSNVVVLHPFTGNLNLDQEIVEFLAQTSIILPDVTNGQLMEFLVDAMVEHAERPDVVAERVRGHDLRPIDRLIWLNIAPPQQQYPPIDPIQVRSQIIWLCVIRFQALVVYHERRNRGIPFEPTYLYPH